MKATPAAGTPFGVAACRMTLAVPDSSSNPFSRTNLNSSSVPTSGKVSPWKSMPDWLMFRVVTSMKSVAPA